MTEEQYKKLKEEFEKYLKETGNTLKTSAKQSEEKGFSYNGDNGNFTFEAYGKDHAKDIALDTTSMEKYVESLSDAVSTMINRDDLQDLEDRHKNLIYCMEAYQQQLEYLAEGLNVLEMHPKEGKGYNFEEKCPLLTAIRNAISNVPEKGGELSYNTGMRLEELDTYEMKSKKKFFRAMIDDKDFCKRAVERAQSSLEYYTGASHKDYMDNVQVMVDIVVIGHRIETERLNAERYADKHLKQCERDMYKPNPIFAKNCACTDEEKNNYISDILSDAHKKAYFNVEETVKKEYDIRRGFSQMSERFSSWGLNPTNNESASRGKVSRLGTNHGIALSATDLKALSGTGTPEYTDLHNKYAEYLYKRRIPGSNMKSAENDVYNEAMNYLFKKKSRPFTQDGKDRVKAAVKILTEVSLRKLADPLNQNKVSVMSVLKVEMLRNPVCREMVTEAVTKANSTIPENMAKELKTFSEEVTPYCDEYGIALNGILEEKGTEKALNAVHSGNNVGDILKTINGKPAPVINAPSR